jgi:hypothetical protein
MIASIAVILTAVPMTVLADDPTPGTVGYPLTDSPPVAGPNALAAVGALQPLQTFNLRGGYVTAGVGMRNRGFGTISIAGIPDGSGIRAAYLFWAVLGSGPGPSFAQGSINSHAITGVSVGTSADPCWGNGASFSYRADVTSLVAGNGDYSLSGFASGVSDGRDPWNAGSTAPMSEGASLVVVFENATSPSTQVLIYEGGAETSGAELSQTLDGFTAPPRVDSAVTTFIGADGQSAAEPGSRFNGSAISGIGWDGSDPQAGAPFSLGNLWDTMTADVTTLVSPGATSATATVQGGPDCLVWVAQVLSVSAEDAGKPVIAVHGINGDARNVMVAALEGPIVAEFGAAAIERFVYYQDRSFRPNPGDPTCVGVVAPVLPPPNGNMPVTLDSINPATCDSQSDLALNAVLLEARVHQRFVETGRPVVLIANSMGAAVVRGMLSYSNDRGDGIAANEVDSVFFLEGAHDGAEALVAANRNGGRQIEAQVTQAALTAFAGIDFTRPAQADLTPKSDWYRWANPGPQRLADDPYFNVHGSMDIVHIPCFFIWCGEPRKILELGDVALTEGTDDPFDTPPKGGSRFLRGGLGAQNYQWSLEHDLLWFPADDATMIAVFSGALNAPEMHGNFLGRMAEIDVADCKTGEEISLDQALLNLIRGRLTDVPYECQS